MKKLFTTTALALATLFASAEDYTDNLLVTVNGTTSPAQETTVTISQEEDGTYNLYLNNFVLSGIGIGNIVLTDVEGTVDPNGVTTLSADETIQITEGDLDGIGTWMGPLLGDVPIDMIAELRDSSLYFIIDIDMTSSLGQIINVQFGDGGYQIGNSDFEDFHTATVYTWTEDGEGDVSSDEPDHWHSFMSCTGSFSYFVNGIPHTFISEEVRPGTSGSKSVLVTSSSIDLLGLNIVANGTITTGRLNAGDYIATSTSNNAFLDIASTDLDGNGDPFYTLLNGKPDSLSVWVKFKQGTPSEEHPYATLTAVITDGSYYQEPVDTDYTDIIVGSAVDTTIATNDYAWQKLVLPFDYESYTAEDPKAILVTISTNADPGEGSGADSLYVDDFELIYNLPTVTGIVVNGEALPNFDPSVTEYELTIDSVDATVSSCDVEYSGTESGKSFVSITPNEEGNGSDVTISVYSSDLKQKVEYTVKTSTSGEVTGIANVNAASNAEVEAIYNLNGQRVESTVKGQVYIKKFTDGTVVKAVEK